jgi:hypothetical protein
MQVCLMLSLTQRYSGHKHKLVQACTYQTARLCQPASASMQHLTVCCDDHGSVFSCCPSCRRTLRRCSPSTPACCSSCPAPASSACRCCCTLLHQGEAAQHGTARPCCLARCCCHCRRHERPATSSTCPAPGTSDVGVDGQWGACRYRGWHNKWQVHQYA